MPAGLIATTAAGIGANVIGQGMGMLLGKHNDKRQIKQQQKLQTMQIEGNRQMLEQQRLKEMQMWKDTNYGAQMNELTKAGLNPGLIYGMSGGGGTTTGGGAGAPTGATASQSGGGEMQIGMGMTMMGAQLAQITAQTENIKAQTEKLKGVDTEKTGAEILNLKQHTQNLKAQEILTNIETKIRTIDQRIAAATEQEQINIVTQELGKLNQEVMQGEVKTFIDRATQNDVVDTIKAHLAGIYLQNALTKAQTTTEKGKPGVQKAEIKLMGEQVWQLTRQGVQKWRELEMHGGDVNTNRARLEEEIFKNSGVPQDIINNVMDIIILKGILGGTK